MAWAKEEGQTGMDNKFIKKFLKGSAFTSIGTLVTIIVHFLSVKVLAFMPQAEFGTYTYIIVISHGFQILSGLGLNLTLVKYLSDNPGERDKRVISGIFFARVLQLLLISVLVFAFGQMVLPRFFDERITPFIVFIPIIFSLGSIRELLFHLLQGLQRFSRYAYINVFSAVIRLSSILIFAYLDQLTLSSLIWVELITYGTSLLILLIYAPLKEMLTLNVDKKAFGKIFSFGLPLYANDMLTYIYNRVSVLLIGGLLTPVSVAMYDMAGKVPDGFNRLFTSLIAVYFPSISELINKDRKSEARSFMNRSLVLASTALSFVALGVFLFREEIILIVASEQYLEASFALALIMINFNLNSISRMMGYSIVAAGFSSVPVKINLVSSAANIIGCLVMIPRYGYEGAVYSLLAMNVISQLLNYLFLVKAEMKPDILGFSKSTILLMVLIAGYTFWGNDAIWVRMLALVVYPVLCWFLIAEVKPSVHYGLEHFGLRKWLPSRSL